MFFLNSQTTKINALDNKKNLLFGFFIFTLSFAFFLNQDSKAQIEELYDHSSGEVSGVNSLMSAVVSNDIEGVKFFLKVSNISVNEKNFGGATALHLACREGNFEIAKLLIDKGAKLNETDNEGWTPLMRAALQGNAKIVDLLITKGANASITNSADESAIIHAAISDCKKCMDQMFLKYNFIALMEPGLLKSQLNEAFVIAKSHDNESMQKLLAAYLDSTLTDLAVKKNVTSDVANGVINSSNPVSPTIIALPAATQNKVFKLSSNKTEQGDVIEQPTAKKKFVIKDGRSGRETDSNNGKVFSARASTYDSSQKYNFSIGQQGKQIKRPKPKAAVVVAPTQVAPIPVVPTSAKSVVQKPVAQVQPAAQPKVPVSAAKPSVAAAPVAQPQRAVQPASAPVAAKPKPIQ
jgi:hypothetical protein